MVKYLQGAAPQGLVTLHDFQGKVPYHVFALVHPNISYKEFTTRVFTPVLPASSNDPAEIGTLQVPLNPRGVSKAVEEKKKTYSPEESDRIYTLLVPPKQKAPDNKVRCDPAERQQALQPLRPS